MNLTITNLQTKQQYKIPERLREVVAEMEYEVYDTGYYYLRFDGRWWITYDDRIIGHGTFNYPLDPSKFSLIFPNSIDKEKVREVLQNIKSHTKKFNETITDRAISRIVETIASKLNITL